MAIHIRYVLIKTQLAFNFKINSSSTLLASTTVCDQYVETKHTAFYSTSYNGSTYCTILVSSATQSFLRKRLPFINKNITVIII